MVTVEGDILCYAPVEQHAAGQNPYQQHPVRRTPAEQDADRAPPLMENRQAAPLAETASVSAHRAAQPQAFCGNGLCSAPPAEDWAARVDEILELSGVRDGYCLVFGLIDGGLVEQLVRRSQLHVCLLYTSPSPRDS